MAAVQTGDEFKTAVESFNRVGNLAAKASNATVHPELFAEDGERQLHEAWSKTNAEYNQALTKHPTAEALAIASGMKDGITSFFDSVMVMAEDEAIQANQLALLTQLLIVT